MLWRNKSREGIQSTELVVRGRLSLEGRSEGEEMNQKESKTKGRFWGAVFTPEVCYLMGYGRSWRSLSRRVTRCDLHFNSVILAALKGKVRSRRPIWRPM